MQKSVVSETKIQLAKTNSLGYVWRASNSMILLANYPENENERESNILSNRRGIILVTYIVLDLQRRIYLGTNYETSLRLLYLLS